MMNGDLKQLRRRLYLTGLSNLSGLSYKVVIVKNKSKQSINFRLLRKFSILN